MRQFLIYIFSLIGLNAVAQIEPGAIDIAGGFNIASPKPVEDRFRHEGLAGRNALHDAFTGLFSSDISDPNNPKFYIKGAAGWVQIGGPQTINLNQVLSTGNQSNTAIVIGTQERTNYEKDRISYKDGDEGFTTDIKYEKPISGVILTIPAKLVDDKFAMLSDLSNYVSYSNASSNLNLNSKNIYAGAIGAGYGTIGSTTLPAWLSARVPTIPTAGNTSTAFGAYSSSGQRGLHVFEDDLGRLNVNNRGGTDTGNAVNTAFGVQALYNMQTNATTPTGINNLAIGYQALKAMRLGNNNFAVGIKAGTALDDNDTTTITGNTFIGHFAGQYLVKGFNNLIIGRGANLGSEPTEMYSNTIIGSNITYTPAEIATPQTGTVIITNGFGTRAFEKSANGSIKLSGTSVSLNEQYIPTIVKCDVVDSSVVTSTTSESIISSYAIQSGVVSNGKLEIDGSYVFTSTGGSRTIKYYLNTTNSLSGAILLGQLVCAQNILFSKFYRDFTVKTNTLYGITAAFNLPTPSISSSVVPLNVTYNPANLHYIIATAQLANSVDTAQQKELTITFKKAL